MGGGNRASRATAPRQRWTQHVNEEWSFAQTLRHLVFITDAWASRTVLDEEVPYHPLGLPQSWYPPSDAAAVGIELTAAARLRPNAGRPRGRMAGVRGRIEAGRTDDDLGRLCRR